MTMLWYQGPVRICSYLWNLIIYIPKGHQLTFVQLIKSSSTCWEGYIRLYVHKTCISTLLWTIRLEHVCGMLLMWRKTLTITHLRDSSWLL